MCRESVRKVSLNQLEFDIQVSSFKAICGNQILPTGKHIAVYDEQSILGIKADKEKGEFIINHYSAYNLAEALYLQIYGTGVAKQCYLSDTNNWMAAIIGEPTYQAASYLYEHQTDAFIGQNFEISILEKLKGFGFKPAIGVVNGFDYNDDLGIYLLLEPAIASKKDDMHLMTLDAFKFSHLDLQVLLKMKDIDEQLEQAEGILLEKVVMKFQETLEEFVHVFEKLACWQTQPEHLTAICLDVFNKNRNIESVKADTQLAKELSTFINKAQSYFGNARLMSDLIQFIIRYHDVDFSAKGLERSKVEQIFVKKKSYGKIVRVLSKMKPTTQNYHEYLESQVNSFQQVCEHLKSRSKQSMPNFQ